MTFPNLLEYYYIDCATLFRSFHIQLPVKDAELPHVFLKRYLLKLYLPLTVL